MSVAVQIEKGNLLAYGLQCTYLLKTAVYEVLTDTSEAIAHFSLFY